MLPAFNVVEGLESKRFVLIFGLFIPERRIDVVGTFDSIEDAKQEADRRLFDFRPGAGMIQDSETGILYHARNWNRDALMWEVFTADQEMFGLMAMTKGNKGMVN